MANKNKTRNGPLILLFVMMFGILAIPVALWILP